MADYAQITSDLNLRYSNTYIRHKASDLHPWETVYVNEVVGAGGRLPSLSLRGLKGTTIASYGTEGEFDFQFPLSTCFNFNGVGYLFMRRPSRQNKRALCNATSHRGNYYSHSRMTLTAGLDLFQADKIYNPEFVSREEAVEKLNALSTYCLATSPDFMLGLNPTQSPDHILFYRLTPIAEVSPSGEISKVLHPLFERKVYDYLS